MPATTRIKQGIRALFAFRTEVDYDLASQYLSASQMSLFMQMGRPEQLHSLNVLQSVLEQEASASQDLAAAALLHDVGKARYHMAVWQKTIAVLTEKLLPALFDRLSDSNALSWWRAPFTLRRQHPAWGAQMLSQTDASQTLIWLVAHHADALSQWQDHPHLSLLTRLKAADDAN